VTDCADVYMWFVALKFRLRHCSGPPLLSD
jgi:hypothetical protein